MNNHINVILNKMIKKRLNKIYIKDELYNLWEDGIISGLDYRLALKVINEKIDEEFITYAKSIGRYDL